jgi:drug/metabolite transporter (DMT)-like permease
MRKRATNREARLTGSDSIESDAEVKGDISDSYFSAMEVFFCGVYGALGSLSGKLALGRDSPVSGLCNEGVGKSLGIPHGHCSMIVLGFRLLLFAFMVMLNGLMISSFLLALERRGTLVVVVISSSMNICLTGLLGQFFLGESVGESWYGGALLMLVGVFLVAFSQEAKKT